MTPWDALLKVQLHPLVWVLLFLLFGPPALMSKTAAKAPGFLGAVGRWNQRRRERVRALPAPLSFAQQQEEIQRLADQYRELHTANAELRQDNKELRAEYDALDKRLDALEADLTQEKRLRWSAIGYIREMWDWARKHLPGTELPEPPQLLQGIL